MRWAGWAEEAWTDKGLGRQVDGAGGREGWTGEYAGGQMSQTDGSAAGRTDMLWTSGCMWAGTEGRCCACLSVTTSLGR